MELLFPLLLVALLVPMFLGVRRQKREAEKVASMQEALKIGDRVTTTSGLYGTVVDADETTVDLEIAEDVVTTWLRAAVRDVRTEETDATDGAAAAPAAADDAPADDTAPEQPAAEPPAASAPAESARATEESAEDTATRLGKD
ncbi:preprotein translocase subunit YajC [Nocardia blacklockiae]|uniref:preprotein translocase subunit YajC n=1 Tax=Nocardia blacklockiae TaxID=480036 RepID=UPI001895B0E3|nr:preprotein translocase subunit YajC [Nocardia blacklockiae]MBF6170259.1 preprotein translocase subunit YajC [Nocardia blacklockiae]